MSCMLRKKEAISHPATALSMMFHGRPIGIRIRVRGCSIWATLARKKGRNARSPSWKEKEMEVDREKEGPRKAKQSLGASPLPRKGGGMKRFRFGRGGKKPLAQKFVN